MRKLLLLIASILCLAGCASVISNQSLSLVDRGVSFTELRKSPDRYIGRNLLLAGEIVGVGNSIEGGELELVQFAADENGEITDTANSGGRFIARKAEFLDPAVYRTGLLVTLVGEVQGKINMLIGDVDYTYPVLTIREIHLWKPEEFRNPQTFHFGFGVGTIIH
jgi:outer membrane lipoprotein